MGMDSYIIFFILVGISMTLLGLNLIATIVTMRAPGLTWGRLPMFCWGALSTSGLMVLAAPVLAAVLLMVGLDRTAQTSFFQAPSGGSPYLFENLFWFFGHPEVYVLALPGFGIILELVPVFARKPLWGYRLAVAGMLGVALLSFFVWQHHLFVSGINSALRPFYMLSTEVISIPTGFIFLCGMATLWRASIRYTVPMLFCLAWFFNFFIGGISGVFLSDTPSDVSTHGSFFVMAHFHYTIMGGLIFTFFAAIYYWVPKMTGLRFNETLAKIHFWSMFIAFNSTFGPLFAAGLLGMPRRVSTYASSLQPINIWVSVSAFVLGLSMLVFLANVVYSMVIARKPAEANPWDSKSLGVAAADPGARAQLRHRSRDRLGSLRLRNPTPAGETRRGAGDGAWIAMVRLPRRRATHPRGQPRGIRGAAGGPRAEPLARRPRDRRDDDHVLRGVRVRVLLPALAQQQPPVAPGGYRPAAEVRDRSRPPLRRQRRRSWPTRPGRRVRTAAGWLRRGRHSRSGSPGAWCRCSNTRISTSARPTAATRACSSAGPSSSSSSCILTMYWVEILFAEGVRNRGAEEAVVPAGLADAAFYWGLLAGIGVLTWAILYLF